MAIYVERTLTLKIAQDQYFADLQRERVSDKQITSDGTMEIGNLRTLGAGASESLNMGGITTASLLFIEVEAGKNLDVSLTTAAGSTQAVRITAPSTTQKGMLFVNTGLTAISVENPLATAAVQFEYQLVGV